MANNNFITVGLGNNSIRCPSSSPVMRSNTSSNRADVIVLTGTDGKPYCFSYEDEVQTYLSDKGYHSYIFGANGFFDIGQLPLEASLPLVLQQLQRYHPEDVTSIEAIRTFLQPPADPLYTPIPNDFLTLLKRVGQCIMYMNEGFEPRAYGVNQKQYGEMNEAGAYYLPPSKLSINEITTCRIANMSVYFKMIQDYMNSQSEEIRTILDSLPFEGYKGRSRLFNNNIRAGRRAPREITFGEFRNRVMTSEVCMGTFAGNIIKFYNHLCNKKGLFDQVINKTALISPVTFDAQCPAIKTQRENIQLRLDGGKRRKTRKRKTRQNKRKN
jgi:hypothetical protein